MLEAGVCESVFLGNLLLRHTGKGKNERNRDSGPIFPLGAVDDAVIPWLIGQMKENLPKHLEPSASIRVYIFIIVFVSLSKHAISLPATSVSEVSNIGIEIRLMPSISPTGVILAGYLTSLSERRSKWWLCQEPSYARCGASSVMGLGGAENKIGAKS